jgi:hypothetical protein
MTMLWRTLLLLTIAHAALAADTVLLPEQYLQPSQRVAAAFGQTDVQVASSGDQAFAVWSDTRRQVNAALFGARIAADGSVLDPTGIALDTIFGGAYGAAWNGSEYVIVHGVGDDVRVSNVDRSGTLTRSRVFVGFLSNVRVAGNGRDVVVGGRGDKSVSAVFVRADGSGGSRYTFGDANSRSIVPVATRNGMVAVFDTFRALNFAKLDGFQPRRLFSIDESFPIISAAADDGDRMLIAWSSINAASSGQYRLTVKIAVTTAGGDMLLQPLELENLLFPYGNGVYNTLTPEAPAVTWDGRQFVVAWRWLDGLGSRELRVARFDRQGIRLDAAPLVVDRAFDPNYPPLLDPQFLVMNGRASVLWTSSRGTVWFPHQDLMMRALEPADAAPQLVAASAQLEREVTIAAGDEAVFAVWREGDFGTQIMGRLLRYNGLDSASFAISRDPYEPQTPAIESGGGIFLVAWREDEYDRSQFGDIAPRYYRIMARRYDRAGVPLDAAPLLLAREGAVYLSSLFPFRSMTIASDGHQFLVAWPSLEDTRIHGIRVSSSGALLDTSTIHISPAEFARRGAPHALWTGGEFSVYWYEDPTPEGVLNTGSTHYARRASVSPNGIALAPTLATAATTPAGADRRSPFDAAFNGSEVMLAWNYRMDLNSQTCVYSQRFTPDGTAIDANPVKLQCVQSSLNEWNGEPHPMWDGARWWITFSNLGFDSGVRAMPLSNGAPLYAPLRLSDASGKPFGARSVATPVGLWFVWSRIDAASGNVQRLIQRRLVTSNRTRAARH